MNSFFVFLCVFRCPIAWKHLGLYSTNCPSIWLLFLYLNMDSSKITGEASVNTDIILTYINTVGDINTTQLPIKLDEKKQINLF